MDIINEINHETLGKIYCVADKNGCPSEWLKKENIKIFNIKTREIMIKFNFFCFNKLFKYKESRKSVAENVNKGISDSYKEFLKDIKNIENEFYEEFKLGELEEVLDMDINVKGVNKVEDLYKFIDVKEVRIYNGGYSVIMSTTWSEDEIGIERWKIFSDDSWYNVNLECEIEPVEMDYEG